jgi:endonuclease/exonuclease/phosphatase family metal-dependent hydrolase
VTEPDDRRVDALRDDRRVDEMQDDAPVRDADPRSDTSRTPEGDGRATVGPSATTAPEDTRADGTTRGGSTRGGGSSGGTDGGTPLDTIAIATWNIQTLGRSKLGKPKVVATILDVLRRYDVVAVQEIKDVSGETPRRLLELLDASRGPSDPPFAALTSPRTGLAPDDRASQEQYAFFFDASAIEPLDDGRLFDDADDAFQREPWMARFRVREGGFSFVLIDIHTRPEAAVEEIRALSNVVTWAMTQYPDEDDFVVLGDFNASCDYASPKQLDALPLRGPGFVWVVPDDVDTTVKSTFCAYDRIVLGEAAARQWEGDWGIVVDVIDAAVSDHLPVWSRFPVDERR